MFLAVEEVDQPQNVVLVGVPAGVDVLQQLDLVETLVEEVLVVLDHLETHPLRLVLLGREVHALQCGGEGCLAEHIVHFVASRQDGAARVLQVLALLEARLVGFEDDFQVEVAVHAVHAYELALTHDFRSADWGIVQV